MVVSIHQPHYFPWIGYFDKIAKSDVFVLLDQVQFEKGSNMNRNRIIDNNGEIKYINIPGETHGFLDKEYKDLKTKDIAVWTKKQYSILSNYYQKANAKVEMLDCLDAFLNRDYDTICEWTCSSIEMICNLLGIKTKLVYQSCIKYDNTRKKSDLVLSLCEAVGADVYLSGRGASIEYLDRERFAVSGVSILFQDFIHPIYRQINTASFIPGVSILDMLFNCGIEESKRLFWENIREK